MITETETQIEPMFDMDDGYFHRDPTPEEEASYEAWLKHCEETGEDPLGL